MRGHGAIEVAKTVMEVADVAWTAMECHHHHSHHDPEVTGEAKLSSIDEELQSLRSENQRLRNVLEQNLKLLHNLNEIPSFLDDCPPDLYDRLVANLSSEDYLTRLKSLQQETVNGTENQFPFKEATGLDFHSADMPINVDLKDPNKCILSNPKAQNLSPEELQKTLSKALGGVSKLGKMLDIWHAGMMFYTLSTWGLALAGLYKSRTVLRLAAQGIHASSKAAMRIL
ncbi:Elongation factor 4 [Quillaja saponaria]|uniref:Elongation factor 4 n=1 Tax=Quillaja saponaria TaxID=32244 RepID=A0AAD7LWS3_QUISA|nr:Elongation factor 4 [Quillaja saponaria]